MLSVNVLYKCLLRLLRMIKLLQIWYGGLEGPAEIPQRVVFGSNCVSEAYSRPRQGS